MTVSADNNTVTVNTTDSKGKEITLTIPVTEVTALTDALLSARKDAYEAARTERNTAREAAKAARTAAKAARTEATAARKAERLAKLEARIAALKA